MKETKDVMKLIKYWTDMSYVLFVQFDKSFVSFFFFWVLLANETKFKKNKSTTQAYVLDFVCTKLDESFCLVFFWVLLAAFFIFSYRVTKQNSKRTKHKANAWVIIYVQYIKWKNI